MFDDAPCAHTLLHLVWSSLATPINTVAIRKMLSLSIRYHQRFIRDILLSKSDTERDKIDINYCVFR